jgi:hypothetical protein
MELLLEEKELFHITNHCSSKLPNDLNFTNEHELPLIILPIVNNCKLTNSPGNSSPKHTQTHTYIYIYIHIYIYIYIYIRIYIINVLLLSLCKFQEIYQSVCYSKLAAFDMMCPLPYMVMSGCCSLAVVSLGFIFVQ